MWMKQTLLLLHAMCVLIATARVQGLCSSDFSRHVSPQFVGFDLGTSGIRISVIEQAHRTDEDEVSSRFQEVHSHAIPWKNGIYDSADIWMESVLFLLEHAKETSLGGTLENVWSICVSGTSASCLLIDGKNVGKTSRSPCRMYNYDVVATETANGNDPIHGVRALDLIAKFAPEQHTARSATGSLAKLLSWHDETPLRHGERLASQSDYIALRLMSADKACGTQNNERYVYSDWHNCLKLGYDVRNLQWPTWLVECLASVGLNADAVLPSKVVSPGKVMGTVSADVAKRLGMSNTTVIVGGTTDSNAAFFAATSDSTVVPGTAVVSLGSTLAIKEVSSSYVENANFGVYSHRYPSVFLQESSDEAWLAGGASNVGCAVLRQENFSVEELQTLSEEIDPETESPLSFYPLARKGERFPIADGNMDPILEPKPESRREYLHGILQGISTVEKDGFVLMGELGATPSSPSRIWTCGGGAQNEMWGLLRQRRLRQAFRNDSLKVSKASNVEASYGAALLAAAAAPRH